MWRRARALRARVTALERALGALGTEVTTRRLVVAGPDGRARVVATVAGGTAEVRVTLPDGAGGGAGGEVVLFAGPGGLEGAAPALGLQLRAGGEAVAEVAVAPGEGGWAPTGPPGAARLAQRPDHHRCGQQRGGGPEQETVPLAHGS